MRLVIQRVHNANVKIEKKIYSEINSGLLVFVGIEEADNADDIIWLATKLGGLRLFADSEGKMNLDIKQINGSILLVSQFTLHASTKKGNRPSFIKAANPQKAIQLYNLLIKELEKIMGKPISTGKFGENMQISLVNDGPVTIIIDSKTRE